MRKHTQGPWHLKPGEEANVLGHYTVFFGHGETIANQICMTPILADARLIAAAPSLLAACKMVINDPGLTEAANEVIRQAVADAEGQS